MAECSQCGNTYDTDHALRVHETQYHEGSPWQDEETLRYYYVERGLSSREVADEMDCNKSTILKWLDKHGIQKTLSTHERPPTYTVNTIGYEYVKHQVDGEQLTFLAHRLLAVAERGFDAVANSLVHHKNGIKWDNRPDNLEVVDSQAEHMERHRQAEENWSCLD